MCPCVYMYVEQYSQVLEQLKKCLSRDIPFFISCAYATQFISLCLGGGSSPPLVHLEEMIPTSQYLHIISKCSSFQALYITS